MKHFIKVLLEAKKTNFLRSREPHNEHQAKAEQYISYHKANGGRVMDGCRMDLHKDHVIIHQEIPGEDGDKYVVHRKHVKPHHWNKLRKIALQHLS